MVSLAEATFPCGTCPGAMLDWDRENVEELKASIFNDGRLQRERAVVEIQNGTEVPGLADEFASLFRKQGLAGEQISTDDYANGSLYDATLIVNLSGKRYTAEKLAAWLKLPLERIVESTDPRAALFQGATGDVIVALGADASLPSAAAAPGG